LEFDVFPTLAASGRCFVFPAERPLVDIGTPERLKAANDLLG
jgi:NDP-sugar pyrophosphorylase family protein